MSHTRENHYIAAYLRRHLDHIRGWSQHGTMEWVRWFIAHGRCLTITDGKKLVGVTLVRCLDNKEQAEAPYADTGGKTGYIEATACQNGNMPYLFTLFCRTFPQVEEMVWVRSKHNNRVFSSAIGKVTKHLDKLTT